MAASSVPGGKHGSLLERELNQSQRSLVGRIDTVGILVVALFVPIAFRNDVAVSWLIAWSVAVALTTLGWSQRLPFSAQRGAEIAVWLSSLVWAVLPWIAWPALHDERVVWMLVAVCGYGLATDALLLPQTFRTRVGPLMTSYTVSYLIAFALHGHVFQVLGLTALLGHLAAGVWGFERIKLRFLDNLAKTEAEVFRDPLTGLGTRGAAMREIERRIAAREDVHCIVFDVDDFKSINTHLGHHGGDATLIALAASLEQRLKGWFVARLGGDEFVAINHRGLHPSEEGLLTTIDVGEVRPGSAAQILSLSLGASSLFGQGTADTLLTEASAALQRAKQGGKQRLVIADDALRAEESRRKELAADAHQAITSGDIVAWGQPILDLRTDRPAGIELLARWRRSRRIELPNAFVPVMEAHGLGSMLAWNMLDHAIDTLVQLTAAGDRTSFVSVNLSALVLLEPDLPERLEAKLADHRLAPQRLVIEMTESQKLPDTAASRTAFDELRRVGVGIASDDLGTGWSSINQMIERAFTHVKVDRTLINATHRRGGGELIASIRTLAEGAGQVAIAEGIETADELERVRLAGFGFGQGYLMGRPAPIEHVLERFAPADETVRSMADRPRS